MGPTPGAVVIQSNRLHGAIAQRVHPARRHYLYGHAALEIRRVLFPLLELSLVAIQQSLMERSEERRVGKEGVSKCRFRWSPDHYIQKHIYIHIAIQRRRNT